MKRSVLSHESLVSIYSDDLSLKSAEEKRLKSPAPQKKAKLKKQRKVSLAGSICEDVDAASASVPVLNHVRQTTTSVRFKHHSADAAADAIIVEDVEDVIEPC